MSLINKDDLLSKLHDVELKNSDDKAIVYYAIEAASEVEAIPIDWINKRIEKLSYWSEKGMSYAELLQDWQECRLSE